MVLQVIKIMFVALYALTSSCYAAYASPARPGAAVDGRSPARKHGRSGETGLTPGMRATGMVTPAGCDTGHDTSILSVGASVPTIIGSPDGRLRAGGGTHGSSGKRQRVKVGDNSAGAGVSLTDQFDAAVDEDEENPFGSIFPDESGPTEEELAKKAEQLAARKAVMLDSPPRWGSPLRLHAIAAMPIADLMRTHGFTYSCGGVTTELATAIGTKLTEIDASKEIFGSIEGSLRAVRESYKNVLNLLKKPWVSDVITNEVSAQLIRDCQTIEFFLPVYVGCFALLSCDASPVRNYSTDIYKGLENALSQVLQITPCYWSADNVMYEREYLNNVKVIHALARAIDITCGDAPTAQIIDTRHIERIEVVLSPGRTHVGRVAGGHFMHDGPVVDAGHEAGFRPVRGMDDGTCQVGIWDVRPKGGDRRLSPCGKKPSGLFPATFKRDQLCRLLGQIDAPTNRCFASKVVYACVIDAVAYHVISVAKRTKLNGLIPKFNVSKHADINACFWRTTYPLYIAHTISYDALIHNSMASLRMHYLDKDDSAEKVMTYGAIKALVDGNIPAAGGGVIGVATGAAADDDDDDDDKAIEAANRAVIKYIYDVSANKFSNALLVKVGEMSYVKVISIPDTEMTRLGLTGEFRGRFVPKAPVAAMHGAAHGGGGGGAAGI